MCARGAENSSAFARRFTSSIAEYLQPPLAKGGVRGSGGLGEAPSLRSGMLREGCKHPPLAPTKELQLRPGGSRPLCPPRRHDPCRFRHHEIHRQIMRLARDLLEQERLKAHAQ